MTEDDLIEYRDLVNGTQNGKTSLPITMIEDQSPRTLLVGSTISDQMIHIYIHATAFGNNYFSIHVHGNEAGGFQNCTHIHTQFTVSDIQSYKIKAVFSDFSDLSFLKALYLRLAHYKPRLISYLDWFENSCGNSGYPSQLALYVSEDILNAKEMNNGYLATTC